MLRVLLHGGTVLLHVCPGRERSSSRMKAGRFVGKGRPVEVFDVDKPGLLAPADVVIRIAGAGVCRTDLHILDGQTPFQPAPPPPFTLGHENAGWIDEVGPAVDGLRRGDPVILHPGITCGLCAACRQGEDMYCPRIRFPGVDGSDGGYAEYLRTSERSVISLPPGTDPAPLAPFADAGITAYHAVRRVQDRCVPGSVVVVLGVGGLGHFAVQLLKSMTSAEVAAVDLSPERLELARSLGADYAFDAGNPEIGREVCQVTRDQGADVVLDFVGEGSAPALALKLLRRGGTYSVVGYGGTLTTPTVDLITQEFQIMGNFVGTYRDLSELMLLNRQGKVRTTSRSYPLGDAAKAVEDLRAGRVLGRAILTP